jgi:hypothetical protein
MKFTSAPPELIVRRATEVAKAMDRLPAGALHANREYAILYNLFVVTDGAVGIPYPKVARMARGGRVTKPAKRGDYRRSKKTSARSLKRIAGNLYKLAPGAVVLLTLVEKLIKLVEALRGAP